MAPTSAVTTIVALLDGPGPLASLRRTLPAEHGRVVGCRTAAGLIRAAEGMLVDSVVLGSRSHRKLDVARFRQRFPIIPIIVYGAFRPDEASLLLELDRQGVRLVLVEGVDDPVVGEVVARSGYLATRRAALADLPRLLRLTEPLQRRAFDLLVGIVGRPPDTTALARRLRVSREHLSRQFGAGGAPNLKRMIDLLRLLAARDLLANPGWNVPAAAGFLGYASASHLRGSVRRLLRLGVEELPKVGPPEVIRRFVGNGARSRA